MPFLIYQCSPDDDGSRTFTRIGETKLAGKSGAISSYLREHSSGPWHMPETEVVARCGVEPADHILVIDLKPHGPVSLYQLKDVWGYSREGWTPLALRLEALIVDREKEQPKEFKQQLHECDFERDRKIVYEFLYLRDKKRNAVWQWGRTGSVNAALLPAEQFAYFLKEILAQDDECRGFALAALGF